MLPIAARASSDVAANGYQRTIDLGASPVEVQLRYDHAAPGSAALAGEGSVRTALPGQGNLTLRLPHVVGRSATLGNAQVAATFDLVKERRLLPSLGLAARVDLPTARGTRGACPGVKATAEKKVSSGIIAAIHVESELWTNGPRLAPGYRAAVGTTLRLDAATSGTLEFVSVRARIAPDSPREGLAQLGLSHRLDSDTHVYAGVAAAAAGDTSSIRATVGIDWRF